MRLLLVLLTFCPFLVHAQNVMGVQSQGVDLNNYAFGTVDQFDNSDKSLKGSPYLFDEYKRLTVVTNANDTINFADANFNLSSMNLEFKDKEGSKFFSSKYFSYLFSDYYFTAPYFLKTFNTIDETQMKGLFQMMEENESYSLLKYYNLTIKESNYNAALDHGRKNDELKINEEYFLLYNFQLIPLDKSKRRFSKFFKDDKKVFEFIKDNKLSLKQPKDVATLSGFLSKEDAKLDI